MFQNTGKGNSRLLDVHFGLTNIATVSDHTTGEVLACTPNFIKLLQVIGQGMVYTITHEVPTIPAATWDNKGR